MNHAIIKHILCFILLLHISVTGCAVAQPSPPIHSPKNTFNTIAREQLAQALFTKKNYRAALIQWNILATINPENDSYQKEIYQLKRKIKKLSNEAMRLGHTALDIQDVATAKRHFLRAMTLDPQLTEPFVKLRSITQKEVYAIHLKKQKRAKQKRSAITNKNQSSANEHKHDVAPRPLLTTTVLQPKAQFFLNLGVKLAKQKDWYGSIREINKYLLLYPNNPTAKQYLKKSYLNIGASYEKQHAYEHAIKNYEQALKYTLVDTTKPHQKIADLKKIAANHYYSQGVKTYRNNLDKAIGLWKKSLQFNNEHINARLKLNKALQLKSKLKILHTKKP